MTENEPPAEYDSPWKEAISFYFEPFVAFFFPHVHEAIDWTRGYEFLDKEFQKIVPQGETGRTTTDKLVKVWLKNGQETWLLIHIEVQSQPETVFAERMYLYNSRIYDSYRQPVLSLAILADEQASWRPTEYHYEMLGGEVTVKFPTVKLLDYDSETLAESNNPFAVIVEAHRETQKTRKQPNNRYQEKLRIIKTLYQRGYERQDILELFRLIDWMMTLPPSLEENLTTEIYRYEEERKMPYVTNVERIGMEKGRQEGRYEGIREAILEVLEVRFETVSDSLVETINGFQDDSLLRTLHRQALLVNSLEAFQGVVNSLNR
ncbi:MAG: transposase [Kamptonema sp. SIO4C4]|nr:transposase [Kamptonema sp. SIO4C4]